MKEDRQQQQQQQLDASMLQEEDGIVLPPNHEISPTKNSLRLMRQISGLGMEDPVFGLAFLDANDEDDDFDDRRQPPRHDNDNDKDNDNSKRMQRRGSLIPLPMLMLNDLFQDMGFDDLPLDMRDDMSVASDPTAAFTQHQKDAMLMMPHHHHQRTKKHNQHKFQPEQQQQQQTPETSTNNSSYSSRQQQHEDQEDEERPNNSNNAEETTTTCTLTKDTLLAEAAQALQGQAPSALLAVARHQMSRNVSPPRPTPTTSKQQLQSKHRQTRRMSTGKTWYDPKHNAPVVVVQEQHRPTRRMSTGKTWNLQPVAPEPTRLATTTAPTAQDHHRNHHRRILPSLRNIFPV
jgi:hypothetical protein